MKPVLRLKQGILIALVLLVGITLTATATVVSINQQRNQVLEQSVAARDIARLSTRMLVLTDTNIRQWWVVHQSMSTELEQLQFENENRDLSTRLEDRFSDLAELFSTFAKFGASDGTGLESRRSDVLTKPLQIDKVLDAVRRWSTRFTLTAQNTLPPS